MENPEHISIPIRRKANKLAGQWIACKFCEGQAVITLTDYRWWVNCITCKQDYYLKEQRNEAFKSPESKNTPETD